MIRIAPHALLLPLLVSPQMLSAATVTDCFDGACATITLPECVAAGEAITVDVAGGLEEGSGFSVTAYGLYENGAWHYSDTHLVRVDGGERIDANGFNWGDSVENHYSLQRPEGRYRYTFFFGDRSFGHNFTDVAVEAAVTVGGGQQSVPIDIKPGSCPNPLNVDRKGVVSVALAGTTALAVTSVDPTSVRLAGVAPLHFSYEDVTTPYAPYRDKQGEMACHTLGADGQLDLVLKFRTTDLVAALEAALGRPLQAWEPLTVGLSAELLGASAGGCGTALYGEDVIRVMTRRGGVRRP